MLIKILGSGSCVPSLKRSAPSTYLKIADKHILVDCGAGTLLQLEKAGLSYKEIDIICITHFHVDHIADLNPFIQALKWTPEFERKKDLLIIGPPGLKEFYSKYIQPLSGDPKPNTYTRFLEEIKEKKDFGDFMVESYKTIHTVESIAYKFTENRKSLIISGDTDYDEGFIPFAQKGDVLLLECSYSNNKKVKGHLIPKECGEIAKKAHVKKLILMHLYPLSKETRLQETKKIFANTILAKDLLTLKL